MLGKEEYEKLIALLLFSGLALTACSSNKTDVNSSKLNKEKDKSRQQLLALVKRSKKIGRRTKEIRTTAQKILTMP